MKDLAMRDYLDYMYGLMCNDIPEGVSYHLLFEQLNKTEFIPILEMDDNRRKDGINFRKHFSFVKDAPILAVLLEKEPCSVLEMMVALAYKCENDIMTNPKIGDRTTQWFWSMIASLGLNGMYDSNYDPILVKKALNRFMDRDYSPNGKGGLFTVNGTGRDFRKLEIWHQMSLYLGNLT